MTNVGLLPMAVAGIDISELVKGARDMQIRVHEESAEKNIAYQYACLRNLYYKEGYRVEMLSSFEPQFRFFYNGGSSFLQKVKEKIIKESFRWQENFRRNCIQ